MTSKESHDAVDCHYAFFMRGAEGWVVALRGQNTVPSWRMTSGRGCRTGGKGLA
jgi:hypothetical protein